MSISDGFASGSIRLVPRLTARPSTESVHVPSGSLVTTIARPSSVLRSPFDSTATTFHVPAYRDRASRMASASAPSAADAADPTAHPHNATVMTT